MIMPMMKKDERQIEQEGEEEGKEGKPQVHILQMRQHTDLLVHTQRHSVGLPASRESGGVSFLCCSLSLSMLPQFDGVS